jgi:hypothetical protein
MTEASTSSSGPLRGPLRKRDSSLWERERNDWYVEPEWCSARLFEEEKFEGGIHDPACGSGNIVKSARAAGLHALGSDIVARSELCGWTRDFLGETHWKNCYDNIVSNPPFKLCDDRKNKRFPFVEQALKCATRKVALLLPSNWLQGDHRSRWLATTPLRRVYFISPRPSMPPGQVIAAGEKPGNGTTDYAWLVWLHGYDGAPEVRWLRKVP